MIKQTLRSDPSLLLLRKVLSAAGQDVPSSVPIRDLNERLAFQLIEKMKSEFRAPMTSPFDGMVVEPSQPTLREVVREMAGSHA